MKGREKEDENEKREDENGNWMRMIEEEKRKVPSSLSLPTP